MRILVSNDDGIHSPGLKVMEQVAHELSDDVWVVAPETEQSGAGHSLTLTEPLRIRKVSTQRYAVRGTPTDCIMLACHKILGEQRPDVVLSGVNRGANIGEDVTYSGTVAAAMEGTLLGIPSIALSQVVGASRKPMWKTAEHFAPSLITRLLESGWPDEVLLNINFPPVAQGSVKGVSATILGRRDMGQLFIEERIDPRGVRYHWYGFERISPDDQPPPQDKDTDVEALRANHISVTPLHLDLTHHETRPVLERTLAKFRISG